MPKASVKRLIECNKEQLVDLVLDIESYPKFIPYCLDAKIYEKKEEKNLILIIADLTIGRGPFKATYKSDVRFNKDADTILVTNIDGPLKHLDNKWVFIEKNNSKEFLDLKDLSFDNENLKINNEDYYYSNVIARASKTMTECKSAKYNLQSTGMKS